MKFTSGDKVYRYRKANISQSKSNRILDYLRQVADTLPDNSDENKQQSQRKYKSDKPFLRSQIDNINIDENKSVLRDYLTQIPCRKVAYNTTEIIYPFGCNKSQLEALRNALAHNISVIEGPPGTGKTQTILNIIANALKDNKTIAVVSGNNSATSNVADKLAKSGYGDIVAVLGNSGKRQTYFNAQHKPIGVFDAIKPKTLSKHKKELIRNTPKLEPLLELDNTLDVLKRDIFQLQFEAKTFKKSHTSASVKDVELLLGQKRWRSDKWMSLRECCEAWNEQDKYIDNSLFKARLSDLKIWIKVVVKHHFRINSTKIAPLINDISDYAAMKFYDTRHQELSREKGRVTKRLKGLKSLSERQQKLSSYIFNDSLNHNLSRPPLDLNKDNYRQDDKFAAFIKQVPVILSTTHSIRQSIARGFIFDYLVIDEASQVDLITASIALSCAKNVIIVGDEKQLPHIVSNPKEIQQIRKDDDMFNYVNHSILTSIKQLGRVPSVTLLEHYRCNPLIIDFCNQRFYGGQLIIKTEWSDENPFEIYTTDRKKVFCVLRDGNQKLINPDQHSKSIAVVRAALQGDDATSGDVCVIAPYRAYATNLNQDTPSGVDVDTVHRFQGRAKKCVIISTVQDRNLDDRFMNDPKLVNVAVSRAKKELKLICGYNMYNEASIRFNMGALIRYMMYYGGNVTFHSIFDNLYGHNLSTSRKAHLQTLYGSDFASENLIHELLRDDILKDNNDIGILCNYPLRYVVASTCNFTPEERLFISRSSHIDFFLFNTIDKSPVLAIEVNGQQHKLKQQAERDRIKTSILEKCNIKLLSLDTIGDNEREQIKAWLSL